MYKVFTRGETAFHLPALYDIIIGYPQSPAQQPRLVPGRQPYQLFDNGLHTAQQVDKPRQAQDEIYSAWKGRVRFNVMIRVPDKTPYMWLPLQTEVFDVLSQSTNPLVKGHRWQVRLRIKVLRPHGFVVPSHLQNDGARFSEAARAADWSPLHLQRRFGAHQTY
jgi:hypothetical protein